MPNPLQIQLNNLKLATQLGWKSTVDRLRNEISKEMESLTLEEKIVVMTELEGIKETPLEGKLMEQFQAEVIKGCDLKEGECEACST